MVDSVLFCYTIKLSTLRNYFFWWERSDNELYCCNARWKRSSSPVSLFACLFVCLACFSNNYFIGVFHSRMILNICFCISQFVKRSLVCFVFTFPHILFIELEKNFFEQKGITWHEGPLAARPCLNKYVQSNWRIQKTRRETDRGKSDRPRNGTNTINWHWNLVVIYFHNRLK